MSSGFLLDKWYLDAVTSDGVCVIAYRAEVRYRALRVHYAAVTISPPDGKADARSSLRGGAAPVVDGPHVRWACPALGVAMSLERTVPEGSRRLFDGEDGVIDWECVAPAGRARLELDGVTRGATGYAERLVMTVPPHRLPMHTLRWGRFVADDAGAAAAWIHWRGPERRDLVLCDGEVSPATEVSDHRCSWPGAAGMSDVAIAPGRVLRASKSEGTLMDSIPALRRFAPPMVRAALGLRETKWLARGALGAPNRAGVDGWVVHEVVTFPEIDA